MNFIYLSIRFYGTTTKRTQKYNYNYSTCSCSSLELFCAAGLESDFPSCFLQVSLTNKRERRPFCGGALINDLYVLTAAHCTNGKSASQIDVMLGDHIYPDNSKQDYKRAVQQIKQHPRYVARKVDNDFSLLKLASPVTFNDNVRTLSRHLPVLALWPTYQPVVLYSTLKRN